MRTFNQILLLGNLGSDPELRVAQTGRPVATVSLATHRSVREGEQWKEVTEWHRVVLFDWQARSVSEWLKRGDPLAVVGELRYRQWIDDQGARRSIPEILAREISFFNRRPSPTEEPESGVTLIPSDSPPVESASLLPQAV